MELEIYLLPDAEIMFAAGLSAKAAVAKVWTYINKALDWSRAYVHPGSGRVRVATVTHHYLIPLESSKHYPHPN